MSWWSCCSATSQLTGYERRCVVGLVKLRIYYFVYLLNMKEACYVYMYEHSKIYAQSRAPEYELHIIRNVFYLYTEAQLICIL